MQRKQADYIGLALLAEGPIYSNILSIFCLSGSTKSISILSAWPKVAYTLIFMKLKPRLVLLKYSHNYSMQNCSDIEIRNIRKYMVVEIVFKNCATSIFDWEIFWLMSNYNFSMRIWKPHPTSDQRCHEGNFK